MRNIKGIVKLTTYKTGELELKNINPNASDKEIRDFLSLYARVLPESFTWGISRVESIPRFEEEVPKKFQPAPVEKAERKPEVSERVPNPLFKKGSEPAAGTLMFIVLSAVRSVPLATLTLVRNRYFQISKQPVNQSNYTNVSVMLTKLIQRGLIQRVNKGLYKAV